MIPARFLQEKCIFFKDKNVRILQDKHFFELGYAMNNFTITQLCYTQGLL